MWVMLNDRRVSQELAQLPVNNYFIGAAAMARVFNACPWRIAAHLTELARTIAAPELGFLHVLNSEKIKYHLAKLINDNRLFAGVAKIAVYDGEENQTVVISTAPCSGKSETLNQTGAVAITTEVRRLASDRLANYKLLFRASDFIAGQMARRAGADFGLITDENSNIIAANYANVFAVIDQSLVTPSAEKNPIVAGVARAIVLEVAARLGVMVYEENLSPEKISAATELFVTASAHGITPLRRLDRRDFTDFTLTHRLQTAFRELLLRETNS